MKRRKLVVPAALLLSGCDGPRPCEERQPGVVFCWPDGGFVCGAADCGATAEPDGGVKYLSDGTPQCMC
jgi:hypothetical protein